MASQIHEQQMQDFAQLVNGRRKLHVKEVEIVVEEFKEARVQTGAILSADDLASLLNDLASEVQLHLQLGFDFIWILLNVHLRSGMAGARAFGGPLVAKHCERPKLSDTCNAASVD